MIGEDVAMPKTCDTHMSVTDPEPGPPLLVKDDGYGIGVGFRYGEPQGREGSTVWCLYGVYQAAVAQTSGPLAVAVRPDTPGPGLRFGDAR